jgi:hypothetical protein
MNAIIGVSLLAVTDLFFTWAYCQYRRPQPRRWTTWELPAQAICLGLVGGAAFGVGLIGRSLVNLDEAPITAQPVALAAARPGSFGPDAPRRAPGLGGGKQRTRKKAA